MIRVFKIEIQKQYYQCENANNVATNLQREITRIFNHHPQINRSHGNGFGCGLVHQMHRERQVIALRLDFFFD